jgi:DNA ligase (NAD+)
VGKPKKAWESMSAAELEAEVRHHNRLYFERLAPEIPDSEFDRLVEMLRRKAPDSPALTELVSDVRPTGVKVRHETSMLSLDKCYGPEALAEWAEKFAGEAIASPKIDGCAVSLRYNAAGKLTCAATRGDGVTGEEITANARRIRAIPQEVGKLARLGTAKGIEVRGEVYMPLSVFARYRGEFANPRNLAAGAVKQKDPAKTADHALSFFAYDLLGTSVAREDEKLKALAGAGFATIEWRRVARDKMQEAFEAFLAKRDAYDFETDGVVFKANEVAEQQRLGVTAHHPRFAIAYKFQGDAGTTTLLDVEWSVSRTGAITPVAIVEPVELSGAKVRRASLHNVGILQQLGVTKGARVLMMRRGGVIPNLESVVEPGKGTVEVPTACPSCGAPTRLEDDVLLCTNSKACVQSKIGELAHFVKTVGIDGFGEKLIARLYEEGIVTDASEFYELTAEELLGIERMGETLAAKLLANVASKRELPLADFLQSLGIRELGKHVARILAGFGALDRVQALTEEELAAVHTIGEVIAHEVVAGLRAKRRLIDKLTRHVKVLAEAPRRASGPLAGQSFLFTGKLLAMERADAQKLVEERGGIAAQSVTKDLDYLVIGDGGGAGSKLAKAKKLAAAGGKVKIIEEKEFVKMAAKK